MDFGLGIVHMTIQKDYKPGDPEPVGYLAWHEWAEVQHKAGLKQKQCGRCSRWCYPQSLSVNVDRAIMQSKKGPVTLVTAICTKCDTQLKERANEVIT